MAGACIFVHEGLAVRHELLQVRHILLVLPSFAARGKSTGRPVERRSQVLRRLRAAFRFAGLARSEFAASIRPASAERFGDPPPA